MDKNLLKRALEDTEDPTPGYMFRDIAQWTFVDHSTQTKLIAALMDKMKPTTSVHVLAKTLKVIKVLCETGHSDFQKEMQRRSDELKQFASYRGKPDGKFGDKLNEKVRTVAREAIDAAFSHRKETKVQVLQGHGSDSTYEEKKSTFTTGNAVTEPSSSSWSTPSTGGGSSGNNAHMAAMPTTNKWAAHMAQMASGGNAAPGAGPGIVASFVDSAKTGFGLWHENIKSTEQLVMESMNAGTEFRPVELGFGGGGQASGFGGGGSHGGGNAGGWKFSEDGAGGAATAGREETKILTPFQAEVERICAYKSTPQRVDLTQFLSAIEAITDQRNSSDLEELAETLDEHLQQKFNWQHRLNAMAAIESVLRQTSLDGKESFEQYFKENPEDVQRNVHVVQGSLKEKAQKVLKLLGVPERVKGQVETSQVQAQQIQVATSNGGYSWAAGAPAPAPAVASSLSDASPSTGGDILGGMTVKSRAGKAVSSQEDKTKLRKRAAMVVKDDEDEAPVQTSQKSTPAPQQGDGGWGTWDTTASSGTSGNSGWGFSEAPAAPAATAQPQQQVQKPKDALDDFFGGPSTSAWGSSAARVEVPTSTAEQTRQPSPPQQTAPTPQAPQAPQAPTGGINAQMIFQMQQQLQALLGQINMSDPNAMAQMQALMAQQQQLMAMIGATAPQASAPSSAASSVTSTPLPTSEVVVPHGHFQVSMPPPRAAPSSGSEQDSFAAVQQEMMSRLMGKGGQ